MEKERKRYVIRVVTSKSKPRRPGTEKLPNMVLNARPQRLQCQPLRRSLFFNRTHLYAPSPPSAAHALLVKDTYDKYYLGGCLCIETNGLVSIET